MRERESERNRYKFEKDREIKTEVIARKREVSVENRE